MDASALAINEQRFASNIKNVLSTEEFGHVAEGNVAEFLKFLPGITIDYTGGNARDISINGVPAANVPVTLDGFSVASAGVGDTNTGRAVAIRHDVDQQPLPHRGRVLAHPRVARLRPRRLREHGPAQRLRARPARLNTSVFVVMRSTEHDFDKTPGPRTTPSRKVDPGFDFSYVAPLNKRFGFTLSGGTSTNFSPEPLTQTTWRGTSAATNGNAFPHTTPDAPYLTSYLTATAPRSPRATPSALTLDFKLSRNDRLSLGYQFSYFHLYASNQGLTFAINRVQPGAFSVASTRSAPARPSCSSPT
jgi:iron complex outermembrane receptor protein